MADTSNGIIYGTAEVKFKASEGTDKTIGWLDENSKLPKERIKQSVGWMKTECSLRETHPHLWMSTPLRLPTDR